MIQPRAHAPAPLPTFAPLRLSMALGLALCLGIAIAPVGGCSDTPKPKMVTPVVREVPALLRGTIGSEVDFRGIEPVLVSGFGIVVGLNGTGGDTLPDTIAATMEREMGLNGIGKAGQYEGTAIQGKSPRELLRDKNVAVVLVQAAIPPGAPANANFDVFVQAVNASSLEGGTLWTTDLRIGDPSTFAAVQARKIAVAKGPVFINPFAAPGKEQEGVTRTTGRVLDGGQVTNPLGIELVMNNPSFSRTRAIVSAINSRFPPGAGDPVTTARGRSGPDMKSGMGGTIELHVPNRYRKSPGEFLQLVRHLNIEQGQIEQYARRDVEGLKSDPALGEDLSWCVEALGPKALPILRELYDYPELVPQIAALKAGARLDDPRAAPYLKEVAKRSQGGVKTQAIAFLGKIDAGPTVDQALRELLNEKELKVRVAAYEALADRAERAMMYRIQELQRNNPDSIEAHMSPTHVQVLAENSLSGHTMQGVERTVVAHKFFLDIVPGGDPLIYISQQGKPRIVLFGDAGELVKPMVVSAWSDRLIMTTYEGVDGVRVYYLPANADRATTQTVKSNLPNLIDFFARKTTPEDPRPGLNMTYSEVVGALAALQLAGGTKAAFATEQEKLKAQLQSAMSSRDVTERPETAEDREVIILHQPKVTDKEVAPAPGTWTPKVVPIKPPVDAKDAKKPK